MTPCAAAYGVSRKKIDQSPEGGDTKSSIAAFGALVKLLVLLPPATPGVIMVTILRILHLGRLLTESLKKKLN